MSEHSTTATMLKCALCNRETDQLFQHPETGAGICHGCISVAYRVSGDTRQKNREKRDRDFALRLTLIGAYVTAELSQICPQSAAPAEILKRALNFADKAMNLDKKEVP